MREFYLPPARGIYTEVDTRYDIYSVLYGLRPSSTDYGG